MPRDITSHKLNGLNDAITVEARDQPGPGGANQEYRLSYAASGDYASHTTLKFQHGPLYEDRWPNGLSNESLLAVLIDRLEGFQRGDYACIENDVALDRLKDAMYLLQHRTRERLARGVEGTSVK